MVTRGYRAAWAGMILFGLYTVFALFFFRDPARTIPGAGSDVVSPADGRVVAIEDLDSTPYYNGPCRRISIFMSPFNVHVNRAPVQGIVTKILYQPGGYINAMRPEASEHNESNAIWMQTPYGPVTVRQISGAIARRIVCRAGIGQTLERGQKFGMIKLGSRTELYLPAGTELCVKMNDKVRAGSSIVARFSK
ncbi:MAG: phosphatidylserine decarboxylase family protein [Candidatus Hydrogenedentes bacterium]|nr:phosphatidylserine decarboxylase family protein [Candidatus Hydrogenedentota bacterium]